MGNEERYEMGAFVFNKDDSGPYGLEERKTVDRIFVFFLKIRP